MKIVVIICLIICPTLIIAQTDWNVEDHQLQIGLPVPAILYEKGISKNSTLSLEALTGIWIRSCIDCNMEVGVFPIFRGQYRYYYNMKRRLKKKKNIAGNSGNYIGGLILYQEGNTLFGNINTESTFVVGPVYGLQRTYRGGFFYRLETGLAYYEENDIFNTNGITAVLAARIGWVLGHKNRRKRAQNQ